MKAVNAGTITFYCWTSSGYIFYTLNAIPNVGDILYDSPDIQDDSGYTVISYDEGDLYGTFSSRISLTHSSNKDVTTNIIKAIYTPSKTKYQFIPNPATITIPNVSILGGLTSADNILNDFSENNYAQLPQDLQFNTEGNQWDDSWEIEFKIKLNNEATTGTDSAIISTSLSRSYNPRLVVWNNLQVALLLTNSTNSWNVCEINSGNTYLTIGDWYWIKVTCLGWASSKSDYNLYISTDGTNYSRVGGKLSTNSYTATALKNIGFCHDNSNGDLNFKGEIDLSESYIKVNNNIWWEGTKELNIQ